MKRLFLDANVLFTAAHNPDGKAALILELAGAGHWEALTSTYAVAEARRNLERKAPQQAPALRELLRNVRVVAATKGAGCLLPLPEKDRPIFASALEAGATHLLTGDIKDFGPFMNDAEQTAGVLIQTVGEFLASLIPHDLLATSAKPSTS